jgi:hypothetical protein
MLAQEIDAKAPDFRDFIGKIEIAASLKELPLALGEESQQRGFISIQAVCLRQDLEASMHPDQGRHPGSQMQIRGPTHECLL